MKGLLIIVCLLWVVDDCAAQDTMEHQKNRILNGYIKNLESLTFDKDFNNIISGNLIHNRLNIKWRPSEKITAVAEFRNRLFWGEEVKSIPAFSKQLRNDNDLVNLQKVWIQNSSVVLHSNTERLNIEYRDTSWNLRVGRQRINWGVTTTWNPNDLFNTYNFLDFDYEERPGVDGARFQYLFSNAFNIEIASAFNGKKYGQVTAAKYNYNKWGYDLQLITGWYKERITLGAGWAGSVRDAGFKGEVQYFFRNKDSNGQVNLSVEADYMFKKGWYLRGGTLFNNNGLYRSINTWDKINLALSPEKPMPTKWNIMISASKEITPLSSFQLSFLYAPGTQLIILLPSFTCNLAANLDADLIWQSFFAEIDHNFEGVNHRGFLRIKWSF